jgi:anti-sigma regulatory factor (Ser/Thr protein kinase)
VECSFQVATLDVARGLDAIEAALRDAHLPEETVLDLRIVAEEVLTNLAKYGHDDRDEHRARVRLTLAAEEVTLEFTDDGRPFDPLAAQPPDLATPPPDREPGGLGIHLALSLVDTAAYARIGSENVLTLKKRVGGARVP